jgi:anthranilate phosphoribosyltransferase
MVTQPSSPDWFVPTLTALVDRRHLEPVRMCQLMHALLGGELGDVEAASLLVAMRIKGETAEELAAGAAVLREYMVPLRTGRDDLLDTCGTGGDGSGTFNISTATALVVAAAGVPVVKHGNRAVSGRCGSSDVLAHLGVPMPEDPGHPLACLQRVRLAFCHAPHFHPALKSLAELRRRLGLRTFFNCLGPLANPAGAAYQLLGVGRPEWLGPMAGALARLGTEHAYLVCGRDGLDEVSLSAPTLVQEVRDGRVSQHEWTAADFGLEPCSLHELRADSAETSAAMIRDVLTGRPSAASRVVLANAAAALRVAGCVDSLPEGVERAQDAIDSGRAAAVLVELTRTSPVEMGPNEPLTHL